MCFKEVFCCRDLQRMSLEPNEADTREVSFARDNFDLGLPHPKDISHSLG